MIQFDIKNNGERVILIHNYNISYQNQKLSLKNFKVSVLLVWEQNSLISNIITLNVFKTEEKTWIEIIS